MSPRIQPLPGERFTVQYPGDNPEWDQRYREDWDDDPPIILESDLLGLLSYAICVSQERCEMWVSHGSHGLEDFLGLTAEQCRTLGRMFITAGDVLAQLEKEK